MTCAAGLTALLAGYATPSRILELSAVANFGVALWIMRVLSQETVRAVVRWYFRTFHTVTISGPENMPAEGTPAVIVVNHQSLADGCFVAAF